MNFLYVSWRVPYDGVSHAGGKTFNYYIKGLSHNTNNRIVLLALGDKSDQKKCDCTKSGIKTIFIDNHKNYNWRDKIASKWFLGKSCGMYSQNIIVEIENALISINENGYTPDVIVLEWTQMVFLVDLVKRIFPMAKCVASEHDVSFLGLKRKYQTETNLFIKPLRYLKYKIVQIRECAALRECDLILCHNQKDVKLLNSNCVYGAKSIVPYYDRYYLKRIDDRELEYITFFGAMSREENYKSVIWFIEKVMPLLQDLNFTFCVLGANPPEKLEQYKNNKIMVTGFVNDISAYLSKTKLAVLPLVLGAGIKVKVLEFAAAGIPIVTNEIGIEGIPLEHNSEYLHCETAEEFADTIRDVLLNKIDLKAMSEKEIYSVRENFDLDKSLKNYIKWLES